MRVKTLLSLILGIFLLIFGVSDYIKLQKIRKCAFFYDNKEYSEVLICAPKYLKTKDKEHIDFLLRFAYAHSLHEFKKLDEAKAQYERLTKTCSYQDILKLSKHNLDVLNEYVEYQKKEEKRKLKEQQYKRMDVGHYYTDLKETARWKNPKALKVYINPNDSKEKILKEAFSKWDNALYSMVNFHYVNDSSNADIIAKTATIEEVRKACSSEVAIGCADSMTYYYKNAPSKQYFKKVTIYISPESQNVKYTDKQYLGTILHEIGHGLGILSHSPIEGDAMYHDTSNYRHSNGEISNRDVNTVKRIYGHI